MNEIKFIASALWALMMGLVAIAVGVVTAPILALIGFLGGAGKGYGVVGSVVCAVAAPWIFTAYLAGWLTGRR